MAQRKDAEARDILRDALETETDLKSRGLGTRIADRFLGIGLKPHEEIQELRGATLANPFEHEGLDLDPSDG